MEIVNRKSKIVNGVWLPDMDLNHDKQIQSLLCYRYTIGQAGALVKLESFSGQSSRQTSQPRRGDIFVVTDFKTGAILVKRFALRSWELSQREKRGTINAEILVHKIQVYGKEADEEQDEG